MSKIYVNNTLKELKIDPNKLELYKANGYEKGRLPRSKEHCKALSVAMTGLKNSEQTKAKKSAAKKGLTWKLVDGKRVWSKRSNE